MVSFCWEKSGVVAKDPVGAPGPLENLWTSVIRDSNICWAYSQASSNTFWQKSCHKDVQRSCISCPMFSGMSTNHFPKGNHAWPVTSCDFEWSLKLEYLGILQRSKTKTGRLFFSRCRCVGVMSRGKSGRARACGTDRVRTGTADPAISGWPSDSDTL